VTRICNFLRISSTLGTAGQPTPKQFADIRAAGYKIVINLAMPTSTNALPNERELVAAQGMDYIHIPVVWESPTLADLERFFQAMDDHEEQKVFVHCAKNMRASAFVLLYRVIRQQVSLEEAWKTMAKIWEPNEVWTSFLQQALLRHGAVNQGQGISWT
jgi:protein tyrosine phosphatase (PTP) superfamily phosphohydrolase (DUF442 family)